ncbi:MAG: hypothetical protein M3Y58_09310, partial [Chloroflexota bacterium]|nr:hypothetical protein [Chloroflexota bacterium]
MRDLSNYRPNDDRENQVADPENPRSLEQAEHMSLVPQHEGTDHRTELYARLRNIIDNATESIRVLKDENATLAARNTEMMDRVGTLEYRIRTVTADLASDELALRKSAEVLEQVLQGTPTGATASGPANTPPETADPAPTAIEDDAAKREDSASHDMTPEAEPEAEVESEPEAAMPVMEQGVDPTMEETGPIPQPEASPVMNESDEDERVIAPRLASRPDGVYTLIAYPFVRFSDLGQFQAALQKLAGVHD